MTARARKIIKAFEKEQRDFQERFATKVRNLSKAQHKAILMRAGIVTKSGKLTARYARAAK